MHSSKTLSNFRFVSFFCENEGSLAALRTTYRGKLREKILQSLYVSGDQIPNRFDRICEILKTPLNNDIRRRPQGTPS